MLTRRFHDRPLLRRYGLALAIGGVGSAFFTEAPAAVLRLLGLMSCLGGAAAVAMSARRGRGGQLASHSAEADGDFDATALLTAIMRDEFVLHYQPIVSGATLQITGVEALLRWRHPTRGLLMPGSFIGAAERTGVIGALGAWVLRRACEDGCRWPELSVAVNVSPVQVRHQDLVETVAIILAETGFAATRLEIELTESIVIDDAAQAETIIIDLQAMGVRVAIDDFGTGYSSLLYLRRFAFDKMKIDRSFVQLLEEPGENSVIISAIVKLGQALGLTITVEGIETLQQQIYLQTLGCDELQGYYYSPPVSADAIDALLGTKRGMVEAGHSDVSPPRDCKNQRVSSS